MKIDVITIFPKMVEAGLAEGVVGRARTAGLLDIVVHNLRDFTTDKHHVVDDVPFGGGPGMVMKPEPFFAALGAIRARRGTPDAVILMSPAGERFTQQGARRLAAVGHIVLLCGRYEGIDERVREALATEEISIGDYVLSGGEVPALVVIDAVARLSARRGRRRSVGGSGFVYARAARLPALHEARGIRRAAGARGVVVGASCRDSSMAPRNGAATHAASGGRICWPPRRSMRTNESG